MYAQRRRPTGLLHASIAVTLYALCSSAGLVAALDARIYDLTTRLMRARGIEEPHVFLLDSGETRDRDWPALQAAIQAAGPRAIAFTFYPDADAAFYALAEESGNIYFGRALIDLPGQPPRLQEVPEAARALPSGIVAVRQPTGKHHTHARGSFTRDGRQMPSLEAVLARAMGTNAPAGSWRIDFRWGAGMLPNAGADQLLAGALPEELLRDRVVLIGEPADAVTAARSGLAIPGGEVISANAYHGFALETLLGRRALHELPLLPLWLLIGFTVLVLAVAYQFLYIRALVRLTLATTTIATATTWALLALTGFWLPLADLLIALSFALVAAIFDRYFMLIEGLRLFSLDFRGTVQSLTANPEPAGEAEEERSRGMLLTRLLTAHVDHKAVHRLYQLEAQLTAHLASRPIAEVHNLPTRSRNAASPIPEKTLEAATGT